MKALEIQKTLLTTRRQPLDADKCLLAFTHALAVKQIAHSNVIGGAK